MPAPTLQPDLVLRPGRDVVSSRLGDAGVLVNLRTNRILELNVTGIRIWELIADGLPVGEIARRLGEEFQAAPADIGAELTRLVGELEREGLLDARDGR